MKSKYIGRVILVVILCFSMTAMVSAEGVITPFSDPIIQSCGISIGQGTNYKVSFVFSISAKQTAATLGTPSYDVQKYVDGAWKTVASGLSGDTANDRITYSFSKSYGGEKGGKYRVIGYFYCKTYAGATQSPKVTSASITLS